MNDFNWDHVRVFLAVARTGRLTVAAAQLGTDHTTVSRRISSLEQDLRTSLFDRSPRGYSLTSSGERFLHVAEQFEGLAYSAMEDVAGEELAMSGRVRIGTPEGFGSFFLCRHLTRLIDQHPHLTVQIVAGPSTFSLSKREADLVVALSRPQGGRLYARKLVDFDLGLYGARDYLVKADPITRRSDLNQHRFISYISDLLYARELDYVQDVHPNLEASIESSNLNTQLFTVLSGVGLCILPTFIARLYPELVAILPDEIRLERTFWLVHHADLHETKRIQIVANYIADRIKENQHIFRLPENAAVRATDKRAPVSH